MGSVVIRIRVSSDLGGSAARRMRLGCRMAGAHLEFRSKLMMRSSHHLARENEMVETPFFFFASSPLSFCVNVFPSPSLDPSFSLSTVHHNDERGSGEGNARRPKRQRGGQADTNRLQLKAAQVA